jgi:hypothetical protein
MAAPASVFNEQDHSYTVGRREYPSVTRVMKAAGLISKWYQQGEAQLRGDAVHKAFRLICEGRYKEDGTHPAIVPFARGLQGFVEKMEYKTLAPPEPLHLVSVKMGYAGTPDDWGVVKTGEIWLPDVKSGANLPATVGVQLVAYKRLLREKYPDLDIKSLRCVHIDAAGKCVWPSYDEPRWESAWVSALSLYNLRKEHNLLGKGD